jgi:tight adherence protein C
MTGTTLLAAGASGLLGLSAAMTVLAVLPARRKHGPGRGVSAIDRYATNRAPARQSAEPLALPGWFRSLAVRLSPSGFAATMTRRLDRAGNPPRWSADRILTVKGLGLLVLGGLGALFGLHQPGTAILFACAGAGAGFFLPDLLLYNAALKRQVRIQVALPDALDMLTVCVEAGLGFDAALSHIARDTEGPFAAECARALQEMQIGSPRDKALRAMADRTTVSELRAFTFAIAQASELGIPIAKVLHEQASEMRIKRRQRAEEKAQKLPVKILIPLITCLLPAMFVVIIGPGAIQIVQVLFKK